MAPQEQKEYHRQEANSSISYSVRSSSSGLDNSEENGNKAVVIVSPYSTGVNLAKEIADRYGYKVICLWNYGLAPEMKQHVPSVCSKFSYFAELEQKSENETLEETVHAIQQATQGRDVVAVICGGEAGVDLADSLSEYMGLLSNGTDIPNRRDKKVQQDLIRSAGIRATRQAAGSEWSDVEEFLRKEKYPVIVKPVDSAGSDGVKKCQTFDEAKDHFHYLRNDHEVVNGGECNNILCQEYLQGKEYIVDHVSLNGVHKTVMVWEYDKRPANGASFVYFGEKPVDMKSHAAQQLIPYARQVLDALDVKHGPTHGEFILTNDGPCLVEMNCRCNGGNGVWQPLAQGLTGGYDQVTASAMCHLNPNQFNQLPDIPPSPFKATGEIVDLVSYVEGIVKETNGLDQIRKLPSYVAMETPLEKGFNVHKTIDLVTDIGTLVLMHSDHKVLQKDIDFIRMMQESNTIFELEKGSCSKEGMYAKQVQREADSSVFFDRNFTKQEEDDPAEIHANR